MLIREVFWAGDCYDFTLRVCIVVVSSSLAIPTQFLFNPLHRSIGCFFLEA